MNNLRAAAIMVICACASPGCSRNANQQQEPGGQVVAHIGSEVLTSLELDNELRLANIPPEKRQEPAILKPMLGELTLRKYLAQQAIAAKLDQDPKVQLGLMRARELILANASMERRTANLSINAADVYKFIAQHPARFADRDVLTIEQIRFAIGSNLQDVTAANKTATSLDEIDAKLTAMGIPHNRSEGQLSQGDLPQDLITALQARKPDSVFFGRMGTSGMYFKVKSEKKLPLEGEAATNIARQSLRADSVRSEIASASAAARQATVYADEYVKLMSSTDAPPSDSAASAAASAAPIEPTSQPKN